MISNQILQNTIEGLKAIGRVEFCVVDAEGKTLAETTPDLMKQNVTAMEFAKSPCLPRPPPPPVPLTRLLSSDLGGKKQTWTH